MWWLFYCVLTRYTQLNLIKKTRSMQKTYPIGIRQEKYLTTNLDVIVVDNQHCYAVIALQGAQVLSFIPKKTMPPTDRLWLSRGNQYTINKAIRGGIPLCFPWFGPHSNPNYPSHGFARNKIWQCEDIRLEHDQSHILKFKLGHDEETHAVWPYKFVLELTIHCADTLQLDFKLTNLDTAKFDFTFAWHSYFNVDLSSTEIYGLQGLSYIDQLTNTTNLQSEQFLMIEREVDRIYPQTHGEYVIQSKAVEPIKITTNTESVVVWNPWIEKSKKLSDVIDEDWKNFVCVENGQVATAVQTLDVNQTASYQLNIA